MTDPIERKLAAILCADVAGYSSMMAADERSTFTTLGELRQIVDSLLTKRNGRIANTAGDSVLAEFPSVIEAVECAVEIQETLHTWNQHRTSSKMELRIGVHVGDVLVKDGDLFGDGVNVAARLQELALPGSVVTSRAVRDHVRDKAALFFEDIGERAMKNITRPVRVFQVRPEGEAIEAANTAEEAGATELTFWTSIQDSSRSEDFEAYLERYPAGAFAALARSKLQGLAGEQEPTADEIKVELAFWETVKGADDAEIVGTYLSKYPTGHFKELAEAMMVKLATAPGAS